MIEQTNLQFILWCISPFFSCLLIWIGHNLHHDQGEINYQNPMDDTNMASGIFEGIGLLLFFISSYYWLVQWDIIDWFNSIK